MKVAVMQPYFFPYLGYFQLIQAVDAFVVYDDVNYIKKGWINRNYILTKDDKQLLTIPLKDASQNRLINEIEMCAMNRKNIETIRQRYYKAPQFSCIFPLVEDIMMQSEKNLARFLNYGLRGVCHYLDLHPRWYISSTLKKDNKLKGQEKILAICEELKATHYINAPGGRNIYDKKVFTSRGIQLSFIQPKSIAYCQFGNKFLPNLSIIDVMMFNNKEQCTKLLKEYELV